MKIDAILVDDEKASRDVLRTLLQKFCPEITIVGEAESSAEAYELVNKLRPALVFLDIQMPVENGFALLRKFEKIFFDVIFVTSFNQYAINAIKFSALDYLLKPVEVADLQFSVKKAVERAKEKADNAPLIINLLDNVGEAEKEKKIPLHVQGKVRFIPVTTIAHLEADSNYTHVFLSSGENILVAKTLSDFEELFSELGDMIRISKSVIVNTVHIDSYSRQEPCIITLRSGKEFEISRRKKQDVLKRMKEI